VRYLLLLLAACGGSPSQAAPDRSAGKLEPVADTWCVTKGNAAIGSSVTEPTVRAVAMGTQGDAAALTFTYRGHTQKVRELASGQERRQLGLKLRAQNGCNLVYVMYRADEGAAPKIDVSVKHNPGASTHADCGAGGYTKVKGSSDSKLALVPVLAAGDKHTLRAAIAGDELRAFIDDKLVWRGTLPDSARELVGPAGVRSDNLAYDLVAFEAPKGPASATANCKTAEGD
jgi:hypothetical protein